MAATKRIVLIDFDRRSLDATRQRLEEMGYEVTAVAEASQVNLALSGSSPDLVILEPMIPGKDGFALCRKIRQGKGGRAPRVILASRIYRTPRLKTLAHEAGADAWLERPRHDELLYQAVARLVPLPGATSAPDPPVATTTGPVGSPEEEPTATSLADLAIDDDELENAFSSLLQEEPAAGSSGGAAPAAEPAAMPAAAPPGHQEDPLPNLWPDELGEQLSASGPIPTGAPVAEATGQVAEAEETAAVAVADAPLDEEVEDVLSRALDLATPEPEPASVTTPPPATDVTAPPEPTIEPEPGEDEPAGGPPPAPTGEHEIPEALRGMDRGTAELLSSLEELEDSIPVEEQGTGSWPETGGLSAELESSVPLPPPPPPEEEQTLEEVLSKIQETSGVVPLAEATSPEELSGPAVVGTDPLGQREPEDGPRPLPPLPPRFLPPRHERRSSWVGWFLGALAVGVILAGIAGAVWLRNRPEPPAPAPRVFPRPAPSSPAAAGAAEPATPAAGTAAGEAVRRLPTAEPEAPAPRKPTGSRKSGGAAPRKATGAGKSNAAPARKTAPRAKPAPRQAAPAAAGAGTAARAVAPPQEPATPGAAAAPRASTARDTRAPRNETPAPAAGQAQPSPAGGAPSGEKPAGAASSATPAPAEKAPAPSTEPPVARQDVPAAAGTVRPRAPAPAAVAASPESRPMPDEASRRAPGATRTPPPRGPIEARPPARPRVHLPPAPEPPPAPSALAKPAPVVRLSELDHPLRRLAGELPAVTPEAREAGIHGRVFLNLLIGPDGTVREARVMIEPGYGLGEAAARAVRTWRYSLPRRDGEPVRVWKTEVVEFMDEGNAAATPGETPAPAP